VLTTHTLAPLLATMKSHDTLVPLLTTRMSHEKARLVLTD
jgi:hypothetical protein